MSEVLSDDEKFSMIEADFQREYGLDVRLLWKKRSGMSVRRFFNLLAGLSSNSLYVKHILGGWNQTEHLLADIRDLNLQAAYFTQLNLQSKLKQSAWNDVVRGMPEIPKRPGHKEEQVEMTPIEDVISMFGGAGVPRGRRRK